MKKEDVEFILNVLRRGTITWPGRAECLNRNRRKRVVGKLKNGNPKTLWERDCDICGKWFLLKDNILEVDHISEVGPFDGSFDDHIKRLYCPQDNLQALCTVCHKIKTSNFNATLNFQRKSAKALDAL